MLVPFFCDVFVGKPLTWNGDRSGYMNLLSDTMHELADAGQFPTWE
jgi:hypothetical protein